MPSTIILRDKPSIVPVLVIWPIGGALMVCPLLYVASTIKGFPILNTIATWFALLALVLAAIRFIVDLIDRQLTLYTLTDAYLIKEAGIFNRDQPKILLAKVQLHSVPNPRKWEKGILNRIT